MDQKSNKELAIETALEYTKSWNAADRTSAIKTDDFVEIKLMERWCYHAI